MQINISEIEKRIQTQFPQIKEFTQLFHKQMNNIVPSASYAVKGDIKIKIGDNFENWSAGLIECFITELLKTIGNVTIPYNTFYWRQTPKYDKEIYQKYEEHYINCRYALYEIKL